MCLSVFACMCVCVESIDVDSFVKNLQKCGQSTRDATLFWDSLMIKVLVYWPSIWWWYSGSSAQDQIGATLWNLMFANVALCLPKNKITPKWINRPFFVNLRITNLLPPFVADAVLQRLQQLDAWERAGLASCPKHGGSWAYAIGGDGIHKIAESRELCQGYF